MIIEIRGSEFVNKGAELMLYAIVQSISRKFPKAQFVMEHRERAPIGKHKSFGIKTKFKKLGKGKLIINTLSLFIPNLVLNRLNFIKEKQIDIVIDASGFAFGDKWGVEKAKERLSNDVEKWNKEGKKIILLPQAFGPFTNKELSNTMKIVIINSDLIYARDKISYEYLENLKTKCANIKIYPDFTGLVEGKVPDYFDADKYQVAIIPNIKMITATGNGIKSNYLFFLKNCIENIQNKGYKPFFLIHELNQDEDLAREINKELENKIPILIDDNALNIKGIICASYAVISSRYHGLASSLFQAVPCLATGWSHKYEMLLEEFGYLEGLCSVNKFEDLSEKIEVLLDKKKNKDIREHLLIKANQQKNRTKEMWNEIFKLIETRV